MTIKKARKEADDKYQEVCMIGRGLCEICETKPAYCCHHLIAKALSNRLRYELKNGLRVCVGCHNKIHSSADPTLFREIDRVIGKRRINWLEKIRREPVKINLSWYKDNLERLNKICQKKSQSIPF